MDTMPALTQPNQSQQAKHRKEIERRLKTKFVRAQRKKPGKTDFQYTDDELKLIMSAVPSRAWELYRYLRELRADILRLEGVLGLPPGDPKDPPMPPYQ